MIRSLLFFCLLFPAMAFSQNYLDKKKSEVKKGLNAYLGKNNGLNGSVSETDSSLILTIKEGKSLPADFVYYFNKKGQCSIEKVIASCDSCFQKYFNGVLNEKKYGWKKLNENQYVSSFKYKMTLETSPEEKDNYFLLLRTEWSKELYKLLTE